MWGLPRIGRTGDIWGRYMSKAGRRKDHWEVEYSYLALRRHGSSHIVRVKSPAGDAMHQLYHVTVLYGIDGVLHHQVVLLRSLHDPPVVDVLKAVARHLLLVRGASLVRISDRVHVGVRMEPACTPVCVPGEQKNCIHYLIISFLLHHRGNWCGGHLTTLEEGFCSLLNLSNWSKEWF